MWNIPSVEELTPNKLPLIVGREISLQEFQRKCETSLGIFPGKERTPQGDVIIYEMPSRVHNSVASCIWEQIATVMGANAVPLAQRIVAIGTSDCTSGGTTNQGDNGFIPYNLPRPAMNAADAEGNAWPTLVVEVAYSESLPHAQNKALTFWLGANTTVQDVLVFKIFNQYANGTRRLRVQLFSRGAAANPVHDIDFGTGGTTDNAAVPVPPCNALGIAAYQIPLSIARLFNGVAIPATLAGIAAINLDLFWVQQIIFLFL